MELTTEFNRILDRYGRDILVLRAERKIHCSCYNEVTKESSRDCPICFGIGWGFQAERHRTRSQEGNAERQLSLQLKVADIGEVSASKRIYYFKPQVKAVQKDLLIEVTWDDFGRPHYEGGGIWQISNRPQFFQLGEGEKIYQTCQAQEAPVRSNLRAIRISQVNGIIQYNVFMEG